MILVEEHLDKGRYTLRAELPGVDPAKDVDIGVRDGHMTIKAELTEQHKEGLHPDLPGIPHKGTAARGIRKGQSLKVIACPAAGSEHRPCSALRQAGLRCSRVWCPDQRLTQTGPLMGPALQGRQCLLD